MDNADSAAQLKKHLLDLCLQMQQERFETARKAMEDAQRSANQEERSTAGDKYDTSRAMSQNVVEMNARQMQEAQKELAILDTIHPGAASADVRLGSLVKTSGGNYYLAISGGSFKVQNQTWLALSPASPLGREMWHKKEGDTFAFRGKTFRIDRIR